MPKQLQKAGGSDFNLYVVSAAVLAIFVILPMVMNKKH